MFEASSLGGRLNEIVTQGSRILTQDFPHICISYSSQNSSIKRVEDIQHAMQQNPRLVALAVVADGHQVIGVTTFLQRQLPTNAGTATGPLMSIWLDPYRSRELRRIGPELMSLRLAFILSNLAFNGYLWTIIRTDNHLSLRTWKEQYSAVLFQKVGDPLHYAEVDSHPMPTLRQLFASTHPLETLRLLH